MEPGDYRRLKYRNDKDDCIYQLIKKHDVQDNVDHGAKWVEWDLLVMGPRPGIWQKIGEICSEPELWITSQTESINLKGE